MASPIRRVWSNQQKTIFDWFARGKGNLVVRARAGTGKTTTIIEGVNHAPESSILFAAFNKSVAEEIQSRLGNHHAQAKTLHGLGFGYLRRAWPNVTVDASGKRALALAQRSIDLAQDARDVDGIPDEIVRLVARIHTLLRETSPCATSPGDALSLMGEYDLMPEQETGRFTPRVVAGYASRAVDLAKEITIAIDFADMIFLPLVHRMVIPWYGLVVVDEAQDMTSAQLALATLACNANGRVVIVGDDRQAIYGFRGADSGSLDRLKAELGAAELGLCTTYRCPKKVVEIAARIVPGFRAASGAPAGVVESLGADSMMASAGPRDFILSRTNAPLVRVCLGLLRAGKKASIRGRDIGKGILALVNRQRAKNLDDLLARLAAWHARESKRAVASLTEKAAQNRLEFLDDQLAVVQSLAEDAGSLDDLRARLTVLFKDEDGAAIMCSTVHRAKGLEAENVFLLEGTFQGRKKKNTTEEDNILYVAVTRSRRRLAWVSGFERKGSAESEERS